MNRYIPRGDGWRWYRRTRGVQGGHSARAVAGHTHSDNDDPEYKRPVEIAGFTRTLKDGTNGDTDRT